MSVDFDLNRRDEEAAARAPAEAGKHIACRQSHIAALERHRVVAANKSHRGPRLQTSKPNFSNKNMTTYMAMQFNPQLAAMKLPQGDHWMRHHGASLCCSLLFVRSSASPVLPPPLSSLGREAAGCEGGTQLARTVISPLGTWKTTGWAEESQMATKYLRICQRGELGWKMNRKQTETRNVIR